MAPLEVEGAPAPLAEDVESAPMPSAAEIKITQISVSGMCCQSEVNLIQKKIGSMDGVVDIKVSFPSGRILPALPRRFLLFLLSLTSASRLLLLRARRST